MVQYCDYANLRQFADATHHVVQSHPEGFVSSPRHREKRQWSCS